MIKGKRTLSIVAGVLLLLAGCTSIEVTRTPSTALNHAVANTTYLGAWAQQATRQHTGRSGLRLLVDGAEAFALRASLAAHAQKSLDVQTYMLNDDRAGRALLRRMLHAAQRSVRVRLLLDDTTSLGKQPMLAAFASHPDVEVRVFNPVPFGRESWLTYHLALVADFDRLHRRMHNKLWLTDGTVAITGGRNIGDGYFEIAEEVNFNDLDVMAIGPVVSALTGSFDAYWNHPLAVPLRRFERAPAGAWRELLAELGADARQGNALSTQSVYRRFTGEPGQDLLASLVWAPTVALWDLPAKLTAEGYPDLDLTLLGQLRSAFRDLERRLLIISPYVVPTRAGIRYQKALAERGVTLTILTNALEATDLPSLHGAYVPWRPALLKNGARLFELRADPAGDGVQRASGNISSLHTKAMAFDDERVFIGSLNADPRAVWWNSEVGLLIDSPVLGRELWNLAQRGMDPTRSYEVLLQDDGELVWRTQKSNHLVTLEEEPGDAWRHFKAWAIRLFGIEHLL